MESQRLRSRAQSPAARYASNASKAARYAAEDDEINVGRYAVTPDSGSRRASVCERTRIGTDLNAESTIDLKVDQSWRNDRGIDDV